MMCIEVEFGVAVRLPPLHALHRRVLRVLLDVIGSFMMELA
jgi:hypothetical protein